jgi:hypothetical protein
MFFDFGPFCVVYIYLYSGPMFVSYISSILATLSIIASAVFVLSLKVTH